MNEIILSKIVKDTVDLDFKVPFWDRLHMCFSIMINKGIRVKQGNNFVFSQHHAQSQQDERARIGNEDMSSNNSGLDASQSTSNKRDMGNPVDAFSIKEVQEKNK